MLPLVWKLNLKKTSCVKDPNSPQGFFLGRGFCSPQKNGTRLEPDRECARLLRTSRKRPKPPKFPRKQGQKMTIFARPKRTVFGTGVAPLIRE